MYVLHIALIALDAVSSRLALCLFRCASPWLVVDVLLVTSFYACGISCTLHVIPMFLLFMDMNKKEFL